MLLLIFIALRASGQVTVDYGARLSSSAQSIPPALVSTQLGFLQGTAGLRQLQEAGFSVIRMNANLGDVFPNGTQAQWSTTDASISQLVGAGFKPMIVMGYTPGWLQPVPNTCDLSIPGSAPYFAQPKDLRAWAQLAAQYVHHVDTTFPGAVTDYEIWNEPDLQKHLCTAVNSDAARESAYLAMFDQAAPAMKAQAQADGAVIRVGGPVTVELNPGWIQQFVNDTVAAQNFDFVSYHHYLGFVQLISAGLNWEGAGGHPSLLRMERDSNSGFAAIYKRFAALVAAGKQVNPAKTPIMITEFNDDSAFENDCCRNSATYSPLFNTIAVTDLLNSIYTGAPHVADRLTYFAASVDTGNFCLLGVLDPAMDCATSPGPMQPYPQYYAYQLLAAPSFLNLAAGGSMATSISLPVPLVGAGFYTQTNDAVVLVNPTSGDVNGVNITLANPGNVTTSATEWLLNASHQPPAAQGVEMTPAGGALSTTLDVPAFSVVGLSVPAVQDFTLAVANSTDSVEPGQTAKYILSVSPEGGFNAPIRFACSGAPANSTCSISPSSLTLDGTNTANLTVTVSTTAALASAVVPLWLLACLLLLGGCRSGQAFWPSRAAITTLFALVLLLGCGGGRNNSSSSSASVGGTTTPTASGTYKITVTASSASVSHAVQLILNVIR